MIYSTHFAVIPMILDNSFHRLTREVPVTAIVENVITHVHLTTSSSQRSQVQQWQLQGLSEQIEQKSKINSIR